jgi:hypothetical protein
VADGTTDQRKDEGSEEMKSDRGQRLLRALTTAILAAVAMVIVGGTLAAQSGGTRPDPTREAARVKYDAAHWPQSARRGGFVLEDVTLPGLVGAAVEFDSNGECTRIFSSDQGQKRVVVELSVRDTVADAQALLLDHVASVQSAKTLPSAASKGIRAGDVGYIGYGGKDSSRFSWIAFSIGNLSFRVLDLVPDAGASDDVLVATQTLSDRATALPPLPANAPLPKPKISAFSVESPTVAMGRSTVLTVAATDPTGRAPTLDFVVGGAPNGVGAQGYVEQDDSGAWRFFATGAGKATLTVRVLGRNGVVESRDVAIEVVKS